MKIKWPTLGEMLKLMRAYKGRDYSQTRLANDVHVSRGIISKYETNDISCPLDTLMETKRATGTEYLPTCESERIEYEKLLDRLLNLIIEGDLEEAEILCKKLSVVKAFPFLQDLNILFSQHECRLFLALKQLDKAKIILDEYEKCTDKLDGIQKYHYYYNKGKYNMRSGSFSDAVECFHDALALKLNMLDKNITIYDNIAYCCDYLGFVSYAIDYLEEGLKLYPTGQNKTSMFWVYNLLGNSYTTVSVLNRSKEMNDKSYEIAKEKHDGNNDEESKSLLGLVNIAYARMYQKDKQYRLSIEYSDKAIDLIPEGSIDHLEAIYHKTRCHIEIKDISPCAALISKGLKLSKNHKHYNLMFEALKILANLDEESAKYLEEKIIPRLLEMNCFHPVLDYAVVLRDYYRTRHAGYISRALRMSELALSIYEKFHMKGVIS